MRKSFKELLLESPIAVLGNWGGFKDKLSTHIAHKAFTKGLYEIVGQTEVKGEIAYIAKKEMTYYLGDWGIEHKGTDAERKVFVVWIQLEVLPRKDIEVNLGYKEAIQMKKVQNTKEHMQGLGTALYSYFLSEGYTVISDMVQFDGARALYSRLSKFGHIQADIIDDVFYHILKKDIDVHQGEEDWDFDTEIWSYDFNKADIKIALYVK